jgi:hypothetical protein
VAEGDAQVRQKRQRAAGDHRGGGQPGLIGEGQHLFEGRRADQPVYVAGPQWVHEDCHAEGRRGLEEPQKARIADRNAAHMRAASAPMLGAPAKPKRIRIASTSL